MKMKHVGTKQASRMRQIKAHQFAKQYLIVYANAQTKTHTHKERDTCRAIGSHQGVVCEQFIFGIGCSRTQPHFCILTTFFFAFRFITSLLKLSLIACVTYNK